MYAVKMESCDLTGVVFVESELWCPRIATWVMHFPAVRVLRMYILCVVLLCLKSVSLCWVWFHYSNVYAEELWSTLNANPKAERYNSSKGAYLVPQPAKPSPNPSTHCFMTSHHDEVMNQGLLHQTPLAALNFIWAPLQNRDPPQLPWTSSQPYP